MVSNDAQSRLAGRRILITGAASGIGAATARLFSGHGARIALLDRNADGVQTVAAECGASPFEVDVSDEAAVWQAVDGAACALEGLDGVVNAAGVSTIAAFGETDEELWHTALDVNLTGPFRICRAALPYLQDAPAATVVTLSSAAALQPLANRSAYAASKSGVIAMSKVMAMELAPRIRVNVVCPGAIDTPMVRGSFTGDALKAVTSRYALGRLGEAEEVAAAILFLTSQESSFMTGATMSVDGGRTYY